MKIFGLAGWSGSGKTTLLVQILPLIIERGITVSTMKHTHHDFDLDRPGKAFAAMVAGHALILLLGWIKLGGAVGYGSAFEQGACGKPH